MYIKLYTLYHFNQVNVLHADTHIILTYLSPTWSPSWPIIMVTTVSSFLCIFSVSLYIYK